jgi:hypothetical protein
MSNTPLPEPDGSVWVGGWVQQGWIGKSMHAHAAAVSAAKDAEIAGLRAEVAGLREFVEHVRRNGGTHLANMAIAVLAARKGTTPTTPPPSPSPRS